MPFRKPNQSTPLPNAGLAAVAAHEAEADPHGQYFLADGTRAMSGDIDVGANNITNVGDVVGAVMDSDFAGSDTGVLRRTGVGAYAVRKDNLTAIVAPSIGDNNAAGYSHGSIWFDTVLLLYHIYQTETAGAAVWLQLGSGGGYDVEVDTFAELITEVNAAGANVAQGNSWHIRPTADPEAERSGFFDPDETLEGSIDGLFPHPFVQFYPFNSATMGFGSLADGLIFKANNSGQISLTATGLVLVSVSDEDVVTLFPGEVTGPIAVEAIIRITAKTATEALGPVLGYYRSIGAPPIRGISGDSAGARLRNQSSSWSIQTLWLDGGASAAGGLGNAAHDPQSVDTKIRCSYPRTGVVWEAFGEIWEFGDTTNHARAGSVVVANGMDLTNPVEKFNPFFSAHIVASANSFTVELSHFRIVSGGEYSF